MSDFDLPKVNRKLNKTIRFPEDMIAQVEETIRGKDISFSAFVVEAVRHALLEMDRKKNKR